MDFSRLQERLMRLSRGHIKTHLLIASTLGVKWSKARWLSSGLKAMESLVDI